MAMYHVCITTPPSQSGTSLHARNSGCQEESTLLADLSYFIYALSQTTKTTVLYSSTPIVTMSALLGKDVHRDARAFTKLTLAHHRTRKLEV